MPRIHFCYCMIYKYMYMVGIEYVQRKLTAGASAVDLHAANKS